MKQFILIILLIANTALYAQKTYVPDDNFEQALINLSLDDVLDDSVLTANISGVISLDVGNENISDLTGIEDFTALTDLNCGNNQISSLDVSANITLEYLFCVTNQLTSLDVSANINLEYLSCLSNQLTSLDVSANTALIYLFCYSNQLTSLDVSANMALTYLLCYSNQLTSLDVRNGNNAIITNFDATSNPNLTCIYVDDKNAAYLSAWLKDATADFLDDETECSTLTYVPDNNFEQALIDLGYDTDGLNDYVHTANISGITSLDINNENISDLTGIEDFTALTELYCSDNQLSSLDVSANTALTDLRCYSNQLASLDVSANTALTDLRCYSNQLQSLDVSSNTALTELYCWSNQLPNLDLSANTALTNLSFSQNEITNIDLSSNTALTYLTCISNQIASIDLTANTNLISLVCHSNELTSLDLRNGNNSNVTYFDATNNSNLTCIYVDDKNAAYLSGWLKDATSHFVNNEADCNAISVNELTTDSDIIISPNPVKDHFSIQTTRNIETVNIYSILGKLLKSYDIQNTYSVSDLNNGVYFITVLCKEETCVKYLIID